MTLRGGDLSDSRDNVIIGRSGCVERGVPGG